MKKKFFQGTLEANEQSSELLPEKWNENSESYGLRYVQGDKVCVFLATVKNETALLNFLVRNLLNFHLNQSYWSLFSFKVGSSLEVSNIALKTKETVKSLRGPLKTLVPDVESLISRLKKELLDPIKQKVVVATSTSTETQTNPSRTERDLNHDPLRIGPPHRPLIG